ncbi:MAG TPA: hypothetical protein ENN75_03355 [candidate division Zixibacteria bacterium]|nr:hypothetical protein [candidate division Zixibacteria bacterium]
MQIPDIIDNRTRPNLAEVISDALTQSDEAAFAVGFFRVSGWKQIYLAVDPRHKIRILTGADMDRASAEAIREALRSDIDEIDDSGETAMVELKKAIAENRVEIRALKNQERFHGKVYLLDREHGERPMAIIGSSNLTKTGLATPTEMNAVSIGEIHYKPAMEWFDRLWELAETISPVYRDGITERIRWYSPFEIYVRALISYVGDEVFFEEGHKDYEALAMFQRDAVDRAWKILKEHRGVIIADGVGLGKTFIGKGLIHRYQSDYQNGIKPVLVLCPAALRKMWKDEAEEEFLSVRVESIEGLGQFNPKDENYKKLIERKRREWRKYQVIIIDEAHSFRNEKSNRYQALHEITDPLQTDKRLEWIFLTATPINNKISDVSALLNLVIRGDQKYFAPDVPNVRSLLYKVANEIDERIAKARDKEDYSLLQKLRAEAADDLDRLFEKFVIRRSRAYIMKNYGGAKIKGKEIKFPVRVTRQVSYSLEATYSGSNLFKEIARNFESLKLLSYRPEAVKAQKHQNTWELGRQNAVVGLIMKLLLKRLESSVEAFRISVDKLLESQKAIKSKLIDDDVLISKKGLEMLEYGIVEDLGDLDASSYIDLKEEDYTEEEIRDLNGSIDDDILALKDIQSRINRIEPKDDNKLIQLKKFLAETPGKILIFSEFADTITYLRDNLEGDKCLDGRELDWITGQHDAGEKLRKIEAFSPESNDAAPNREIDVLLSTDVLAEGLNLQDAQTMVNYDLTWNPVRVIQRIGRIDRLGSLHDEILVGWFGAEDGLDELLGLYKRFMQKTVTIAETIGIEEELPTIDNLLEFFDEKNFNETGDVTFREEMIGELRRIYNENKELVEGLRVAPKKIRGAKIGDTGEQIFNYEMKYGKSEDPKSSPYFLIWDGNEIVEDVKKAFGIMKSEFDESTPKIESEIDWSRGISACEGYLDDLIRSTKRKVYEAQRLRGKLRNIREFIEVEKEHDLVNKLESVHDESLKKKLRNKWDELEGGDLSNAKKIIEIRDLLKDVNVSRGDRTVAELKGEITKEMICREIITRNNEV